MRLRHLAYTQLVDYAVVSRTQEQLAHRLLAFKANPSTEAPPPIVITTQFRPVYTCGRREVGFVTPEQERYLRAGGRADFQEALRGGQTTFHGPGQLVAYPIIDLKRHGLTARCYVHLLEDVVMGTCKHFGVETRRTSNPGVWVDDDRKICAVGVHLRRNVSSHGIGLNVSTDLWWFDRITACGLEDKSATSLTAVGVKGVTVDQISEVFVDNLRSKLQGVTAVERIELTGEEEHIIG
ncbi:hypothetical protein AMS68_003912 [Peltaster fructicola]|uniref:Octanoyltransferase n=1 Tax=Peltaster fructicola TaxID=286661 RepID=A0A6H0XUR4_9PEZI|nr:hypothetical protein AMS68_003912 [Peltaster fructicola]